MGAVRPVYCQQEINIMGSIRCPEKVLLFCGVIYAPEIDIGEVRADLADAFGPVMSQSDVFAFDMTDYYEGEMGAGLLKIFFAFEENISPEEIVDVKLRTNGMEQKYYGAGETYRRVNLDPGYVALSKMVLATTKDYRHRIYIGRGIFAEVTLNFVKKTFTELPWTYPDFRTQGYIDYFNGLRETYARSVKEKKAVEKNL